MARRKVTGNRKNVVGSLLEVAKALDQPVMVIRAWRQIGMPGHRGQWDLDAIREWHEARERERQPPQEIADLDKAMATAKLTREVARAKREQINLQREQGKVIDVDECNRMLDGQARWFVGVMDRAAVELTVELADLLTDRTKARKRVADWFAAVRREAARR